MSRPKYEIVKEEIRGKLKNGVWLESAQITPERILSEELGVSRITVKRAVADLIAEGVLVHLPGRRGTFVREQIPRHSSAKLIGVAIDDVSDSFGSELLRGIEDFFWNRRFHTLICNGDRDFAKVEDYFSSLIEHNIAGLIISPVIDHGYVKNNLRLLSFLQQHRLPFVLVDRYVPGKLANYVGVNHRESSCQIVHALIERGHRRILIGVGLECTSMDERLQGYRDALEEAGLPVDEKLIIRSNDNLLYRNPDEREIEAMREKIGAAGNFSCFYALNSRLLYSGIKILQEMDIGLGSSVSVTSHDEIHRQMTPYTDSIIHANQPCYKMGWEAARILLEHVSHPEAPIVQMTLKAKVIIPN